MIQNTENKGVRELQVTADGSHTLFVSALDEHYHSVNGAVQEARHVYIDAGLRHVKKSMVCVFEVGFGTGLNAFLSLLEAEASGRQLVYYAVELYPLDAELIGALNYAALFCPEKAPLFEALHAAAWNEMVAITPFFSLCKLHGDSNTCTLPAEIDLVYFDAFAPEKQPEMWNLPFFASLFNHSASGAMLTTYCAKGMVRRMMQEAGYSVERIPGPIGKREMLRATKL